MLLIAEETKFQSRMGPQSGKPKRPINWNNSQLPLTVQKVVLCFYALIRASPPHQGEPNSPAPFSFPFRLVHYISGSVSQCIYVYTFMI